MVMNPFQEGVTVQVQGDSSNLNRALRGAENSLLGFGRTAKFIGGAILAGALAAGFAKAVQAAAEWEEKIVEISKVTSEATAEELSDNLQELSEELPVATTKLAEIAEIAGRLGIEGSEDIEEFTTTISKLAIATDLTAEDAAQDFARIANALDVPIDRIENLGSAINTLSNNFAASSSEIVDSVTRAAPAAAQLGVAAEDLAAIQTVLVASGQRVERAGTRMNRAFTKLSQETEAVADATGMTVEEFENLLEENPTEALMAYLEHLQGIESSQERVNEATEIFGSAGAKAVLTLANNMEDLERAADDANRSMEEGESLNEEYRKASQTFNSELQRLQNAVGNLAREIGKELLPAMTGLVKTTADVVAEGNDFIRWLRRANDETGKTAGAIVKNAEEMKDEFTRAQQEMISDAEKTSKAFQDAGDAAMGLKKDTDKATDAVEDYNDAVTPEEDRRTIFDMDVEDAASLLNTVSRLRQAGIRGPIDVPEAEGAAGIGFATTGQQGTDPFPNIVISVEGDTDVVKDVALEVTNRQLQQARRENNRLNGRSGRL